jgi:hypothetical protein
MKRRAVMVANPGEQGTKSYLGGVLKDVENYRQFLLSAIGGLWYNAEIVEMMLPSAPEVSQVIRQLSSCDYSLVIFSGHGYYSTRLNSTVVELRSGEQIDSAELRAGAAKHTLILDCCRKSDAPIPLLITDAMKVAKAKPQINRDNCRKYYDEAIEKCGRGLVVMHACSIDEEAGDDAQKGGYYSYNLLGTSITWADSLAADTSVVARWATVVAAHDAAAPHVKRISGNRQNPVIEKPRSSPYYPFCIVA